MKSSNTPETTTYTSESSVPPIVEKVRLLRGDKR